MLVSGGLTEEHEWVVLVVVVGSMQGTWQQVDTKKQWPEGCRCMAGSYCPGFSFVYSQGWCSLWKHGLFLCS